MKRLKSKIDLDDSSKRQKNGNDLVDTISTLPDSILGLILSFLPTKEAVWTSVLSKRWKLVWVTVQNLDFFYVGSWKERNDDENRKFVRFVNRVLLVNDVGLINKFSLVWHPLCISSHCSSWISTAITRNVRHLFLSGEFDLPITVFSCDSLLSLVLKGRIYVPGAFTVCLPRLESLELDGVDFGSEEAFEKLINGCSRLNYLCLDIYSNDDDDFTYVISSASLRRFELCFKHKCSLKLKASLLDYIEVFGCITETFVQENLSSLVGAYFSIHLLRDEFLQDHICNSVVEAVRAFDCGKALNLSADVMRPITRFHPGRVFNMLRRQSLRPDNVKMFLLHEAVLSREFEDQIYDIFQLLPPNIQVGLFTATVTPGPCQITRELMNKPVSMLVKRDELTLKGVAHFYVIVQNENDKLERLSSLFESVAASIRFVIFVNTRRKVDWLTNEMRGRGRTVYAIHGDMDQNTRDIIMRKFYSGSPPVLITTNPFGGGINVWHSINYDMPTLPEKYLHRYGLFGRKKGGALSFTTPEEEKMVFEIEKFYNVEVKKLGV